jgi:hypothetical protein
MLFNPTLLMSFINYYFMRALATFTSSVKVANGIGNIITAAITIKSGSGRGMRLKCTKK